MFKNKNIYLNSYNEIYDFEQLRLTKYCEWPGCEKKGEYRAPTSREKLRTFKFFCLEHIKDYNKAWDYFKGRSIEQIYNEVSNDAYWHRKTRKKINKLTIEDELNFFEKKDSTFRKDLNQNKTLEINIRRSLQILDLNDFCNINQLKKQYKKMVKKYHPDLNQSGCNEKIIKLNNAYSSLINFLKK